MFLSTSTSVLASAGRMIRNQKKAPKPATRITASSRNWLQRTRTAAARIMKATASIRNGKKARKHTSAGPGKGSTPCNHEYTPIVVPKKYRPSATDKQIQAVRVVPLGMRELVTAVTMTAARQAGESPNRPT